MNPLWILHKIFLKIAFVCNRLAHSLYKKKSLSSVQQWRKDNGDKTLRLNYDLDEHSIVFDLGGYEGQWSSDIYSKYRCSLFVFEPIKEYAMAITKRFNKNPHIKVYPFGLLDKTGMLEISLDDNSSSLFTSDKLRQKVNVVKISDFFLEHSISVIDLMKINIEGSEYPLLDNLLENNLVKNIKNIQIQFHAFVPNAKDKMQKIQDRLSRTHHLTYQYPFVWENWERD
jgi:FkbM family methyltransferase